jgi:hypothetical protein
MNTNVNLAAPVGVLALLGTCGLLLLVGLGLAYSLIMKRRRAAQLAFFAAALLVGLYFGTLLLFSLSSHERVLARGEEKHFCEIDCHLAYAVSDVRETKTLGAAPDQVVAEGTFRVVTIKTRFDESTISATRGDALLYPNSRVVSVSDENGKQYFSAVAAQKFLEKTQTAGTPLTQPLRPGESYSTSLVFDLPVGFKGGTLLLQEGELLTSFVIGHENSLLHKKTRFQI